MNGKTKKLAVPAIGAVAAILCSAFLLGIPSEAEASNIYVVNPGGTYMVGDTITIPILLNPNGNHIKAWEGKILFNRNVLNAVEVTEGDFFDGYQTFFSEGIINNQLGTIINLYDLTLGQGNKTTEGTILNIEFMAVHTGYCEISPYSFGVTEETHYLETPTLDNATIFIYSEYDMNFDRQINMLDLFDVAQHYGETGSPGWIHQDVSKDGKITVLDLVFIAIHYGTY